METFQPIIFRCRDAAGDDMEIPLGSREQIPLIPHVDAYQTGVHVVNLLRFGCPRVQVRCGLPQGALEGTKDEYLKFLEACAMDDETFKVLAATEDGAGTQFITFYRQNY